MAKTNLKGDCGEINWTERKSRVGLDSHSAADNGADFFTAERAANVVTLVHIEDNDGYVVVLAKCKSGAVHDLEVARQGLVVGDGFEACGIIMLARILVVDSVDVGCFENDVCSDLTGAKGSGGISCLLYTSPSPRD